MRILRCAQNDSQILTNSTTLCRLLSLRHRLFYRKALLFPAGIAAVEGACRVAVFSQQNGCSLAARLAAMVHVAIGHNRLLAWNAGKFFSEPPQWNVDRALHMPIGVLPGSAHIDYEGLLIACESIAQFSRVDERISRRAPLQRRIRIERLQARIGSQTIQIAIML